MRVGVEPVGEPGCERGGYGQARVGGRFKQHFDGGVGITCSDGRVRVDAIAVRDQEASYLGEFPRQVGFGPVVHLSIVVDGGESCSSVW